MMAAEDSSLSCEGKSFEPAQPQTTLFSSIITMNHELFLLFSLVFSLCIFFCVLIKIKQLIIQGPSQWVCVAVLKVFHHIHTGWWISMPPLTDPVTLCFLVQVRIDREPGEAEPPSEQLSSVSEHVYTAPSWSWHRVNSLTHCKHRKVNIQRFAALTSGKNEHLIKSYPTSHWSFVRALWELKLLNPDETVVLSSV